MFYVNTLPDGMKDADRRKLPVTQNKIQGIWRERLLKIKPSFVGGHVCAGPRSREESPGKAEKTWEVESVGTQGCKHIDSLHNLDNFCPKIMWEIYNLVTAVQKTFNSKFGTVLICKNPFERFLISNFHLNGS